MKEEERRSAVREYLLAHPDYKKAAVVRYFSGLNFKRSTVFNIIRRFEGGRDTVHKKGSRNKAVQLWTERRSERDDQE